MIDVKNRRNSYPLTLSIKATQERIEFYLFLNMKYVYNYIKYETHATKKASVKTNCSKNRNCLIVNKVLHKFLFEQNRHLFIFRS